MGRGRGRERERGEGEGDKGEGRGKGGGEGEMREGCVWERWFAFLEISVSTLPHKKLQHNEGESESQMWLSNN